MDECVWYSRVGACRRGERCYFHHDKPDSSNCLLLPHLYNRRRDDFEEFYTRLCETLRDHGEFDSVFICDNEEPHLDGNVYVLYRDELQATVAFSNLPGSPIVDTCITHIEYCPVIDYKKALCPDYEDGGCTTKFCNYIHSKKSLVINLDFVHKMLNLFKSKRMLDLGLVTDMLRQTKAVLYKLPSLVYVNIPEGNTITICVDVHGQFFDLLEIFSLNGYPSEENPYLFNGDFVDRGKYSVEVILTLFAFKCTCPTSIYLNRGNHESRGMNEIHGFNDEVKKKLDKNFIKRFAAVFDCLPLAHVINKKIFVVHGGLCSRDVTLEEIRSINRFCEPGHSGLMCDLLWSDPQHTEGRSPNSRGCGIFFGRDVTKAFLQMNCLDLVVRSHEVKTQGYAFQHHESLITIFSAPDYSRGNKGAFIRFKSPSMEPRIRTFTSASGEDTRRIHKWRRHSH